MSTTTSNSSSSAASGGGTTTQNSLLTVSTHRNHYDFKTRRSSSEPVHDQVFLQSFSSSSDQSVQNKVLTPTSSKDTTGNNNDLLPEDEVPQKEDGFIDCLQNMTNINKVSQYKKIKKKLYKHKKFAQYI